MTRETKLTILVEFLLVLLPLAYWVGLGIGHKQEKELSNLQLQLEYKKGILAGLQEATTGRQPAAAEKEMQ